MRNTIAMITNGTLHTRDPDIWGSGTMTCASDSKHFGAWDQNLTTQWHVRYGGRGVECYQLLIFCAVVFWKYQSQLLSVCADQMQVDGDNCRFICSYLWFAGVDRCSYCWLRITLNAGRIIYKSRLLQIVNPSLGASSFMRDRLVKTNTLRTDDRYLPFKKYTQLFSGEIRVLSFVIL